MATVKVTFTLDEPTIARLRQAAERLGKPKSQIVRDAIHEYSERLGRLSARERRRLLRAFDELVPRIPPRPVSGVEKELKAIRQARRAAGRRSVGKRSP